MYVSPLTHTLLSYPLLLVLNMLLAVLQQLWTRCPTWDLSYRQCIAAFTQRWKITKVSKNKTHVDIECKKIQKWQQPWFWLPHPRQMRLICYQSCHELYPDLLFCSVSGRQWWRHGFFKFYYCLFCFVNDRWWQLHWWAMLGRWRLLFQPQPLQTGLVSMSPWLRPFCRQSQVYR